MTRLFIILLTITSFQCMADGMVVDKVYHPYVTVNERVFEWRVMSSQTDSKNVLAQRIGYGHSFYENIAFEIFVIGERDQTDNFQVSGFEFETRWMLTQQGEFWADWGMIMEFEKRKGENDYEASIGVVFEKEISKTSLTMNFFAIHEWGQNLKSEWESEFRLQYRYRFIPEIQPSFELFAGEEFLGIGPGFMGVHRIDGQKQIKWEAGFITEISHAEKNHTFRFALEYEF